jgi:hypothetical protein
VTLSQQTDWDTISEFGIHSGEPGLNNSGRIVIAKSPHDLKSEAKTRLDVTVGLPALSPPIHGTNILHFRYISNYFSAN